MEKKLLLYTLFILIGSTISLGQYCARTFKGGTTIQINDVSIADISNTASGRGADGYSDFTAQSTDLTAGTTYTLNIDDNTVADGHYGRVYIDWNQDNDFDDADETYTFATTVAAYSTTIAVPATATTGNTRMRIMVIWNGGASTDACYDLANASQYGEAEDYTVNVVAPEAPGGVSSDLQLWLKADAGTATTTDGGEVTSWDDQSLNGFSATNANTGSSPDFVENAYNFNPGVDFNGSSNGLDLGSDYIYSTNEGMHIFAVSKPDLTTSKTAQFIIDFGLYATAGYGLGIADDRLRGYTSTSHNGVANNHTQTDNNLPQLVNLEIDFGNEQNLLLNGIEVDSDPITLTQLTASEIDEASAPAGSDGPVMIGRQSKTNNLSNDNGRYHSGTMAEVIVYNEDITDLDRLKVHSYLATKYGISLGSPASTIDYTASDGTVFWTGNATYQNDVAGIGQDNASGLNQLQSLSTSSDGIVTMGLGEIATTNLTNANSFSSDLSFMMWGNDNDDDGTIEEINSEIPDNILTRIDREWYIQETGTVGTVDIQFDLSSIAVSGNEACDFVLIVGSDADFSSGQHFNYTADDFTSDIVSFNDIDFTNGQYFTLGTSRILPGGVCSSIAVWYDASELVYNDNGNTLTTDGQDVEQWNEKAYNPILTNDQVANSNTSDDNPVWDATGINYNPSVVFDGDDALATSTSLASTTFRGINEGAMISVMNLSSQTLFSHSTSTPTLRILIKGSNARLASAATDWNNTGNWSVISGIRPTNELETFKNGLSETVNTSISSGSEDAHLYFGRHDPSVGSAFGSGQVAEVITFKEALVDSDQLKVESYLALKYGLTLGSTASTINYTSSDGTVFWTGDATYQNDIAGIGRDDLSGLIQLQSTSIEDDGIVAMGLGEINTTNALNSSSFSADQSFMMWGNDNDDDGTIEEVSTELSDNIYKRLDREWIIQETGTVGAVDIEIDLTGISVSATQACEFILLIDSDGDRDFTTGTITKVIASNFASDIVYFNDHDFSDNDCFTLATQSYAPGAVQCATLWMKADQGVFEDFSGANAGSDAVEDGDIVQSWQDQSEYSDAIEAGASGTKPIWNQNSINFNPGITFTDDGDQFLKTSIRPTEDDMTLVGTFKTLQSSSAASFWGAPSILSAETSSQTDDYALAISNGSPFIKAEDGNTWGAISAQNTSDNTPHLAIGTREKGVATATNLYLDGLLSATGTTDDNSLTSPGGIGIGNTYSENASAQFEGIIPEVVIYNTLLSDAKRLKIESYLATKYGFTLGTTSSTVDYTSSEGTVFWTGDATYQNDIAGLARDDASELDQKQAKSESSDAILTIGNTSIDTDNTSNVNTLSTNDNFFMWGNNDGDLLTRNLSDVGTTVNSEVIEARMSRAWKAQETGTIGSVKLQFDMSAIGGVTGAGDNDQNQVRLLVDQDGVFSAGATSISPTSINNTTDIIEFDHDFASGTGFFFTLGSLDSTVAPLPVTFISFEAHPHHHKIDLIWETSFEENNSHFIIERSTDTTIWTSIGTVQGQENSSHLMQYSFSDNHPEYGVSYYRIRQVDFDNNTTSTDIEWVDFEHEKDYDFIVYPNPTRDFVNIEFDGNFPGRIELSVFNVDGELLRFWQTEDTHFVDLSLQELPNGLYTISIKLDEDQFIEKIMKR